MPQSFRRNPASLAIFTLIELAFYPGLMVRQPKSLAVTFANWRHLVLHLKIYQREQIASEPQTDKCARNGRLPVWRIDSLLSRRNSLIIEIFSLLICLGNCSGKCCSAAVSCSGIGSRGPENAKYPFKFPLGPELSCRRIRSALRTPPTR